MRPHLCMSADKAMYLGDKQPYAGLSEKKTQMNIYKINKTTV